MKLNLDCMRDVLLLMENASYLESIPMKQVYNSLSDYSEDDINYSVLKMNEANFIEICSCSYDDEITIISLEDICYTGHQFLANIRSDNVWGHTKGVLKKLGIGSVQAASQIAMSIINTIINKQLGLPI